MMAARIPRKLLVSLLLVLGLAAALLAARQQTVQAAARPMNILFIILDDVGKDQLSAFNPAALTAALTPNLNAIVAAGVRFTNFVTMPE
jgi:hypothetical protein